MEARQFQYENIGRWIPQQIEYRHTDVATYLHDQATGRQHFADQGCHSALAIGAGDGHYRRGTGPGKEFHIADDLEILLLCCFQHWLRQGHPWTHHHQVGRTRCQVHETAGVNANFRAGPLKRLEAGGLSAAVLY